MGYEKEKFITKQLKILEEEAKQKHLKKKGVIINE